MRICFDARKMADFGIGQYIQNLLSAMLRRSDAFEIELLLRSMEDRILLPSDPRVKAHRVVSKVYSLTEQWELPLKTLASGADILHVPHYNVPAFPPGRLVATIHDLIHLRFQGQVPSWLGRVYAWLLFRVAARRCDALIAISQCTQRDMIQLAGARPEKVRVIPYGKDDRFSALSKEQAMDIPGVGAGEKVLLAVGNGKPHKNVEILFDAIAIMPEPRSFKLVIAGGAGAASQRLRRHAEAKGVQGVSIFLGDVPHEKIPSLYRRATALLFPSLYEGFGLPPLEAMASGVPVLASSAASIPEVVGDAGILLNPVNARMWQEAIARILSDEALRTDLASRGLARAKIFSWDRAAEETLGLYAELIATRR